MARLTGVWGREVVLIDGQRKYARAPAAANAPLDMLSNRWSTMPTHLLTREQELPLPDQRAWLDAHAGQRGARWSTWHLGRERSRAVLGRPAIFRQPPL